MECQTDLSFVDFIPLKVKGMDLVLGPSYEHEHVSIRLGEYTEEQFALKLKPLLLKGRQSVNTHGKLTES